MEVLDSSDKNVTGGEASVEDGATKNNEMEGKLFRIEIENDSSFLGFTLLKKILTKKLNLKFQKLKFAGKVSPLVFVTFTCEEDQEVALKAINNFVWKDQKLCAKKASPVPDFSVQRAVSLANSLKQKVNLADSSEAKTNSTGDPSAKNESPDPSEKKRKADLLNSPEEAKKVKTNNHADRFIPSILRQAITPLWQMPYEQQLIRKGKDANKILARLTLDLLRANHIVKEKTPQPNEEESLCCPPLPTIGSPQTSAYCNSYEFPVGLHPDSDRPTVGYRVNWKNHVGKRVADACYCTHIPPIMVKAAELFQAYLRVSSLPVFDTNSYEGFWRKLIVRTSRKGQLLLIVDLHPQNLSQEEIEDMKTRLKAFFSSSELEVSSLYLQKSVSMDKTNSQLQHVCGATHIEEEFLGLTFRISPDGPFPTNTSGAEALVSTLKDFASLTKQTTLLYVGCGTGAFAITLARDVLKVIGIDSCQIAIEDAWHNARANGINNVDFVCGQAEDVISRALKKVRSEEDVTVILEPPKAGLNTKVVRKIRGAPGVKRVAHLSCNPNQSMNNYLDLCRPTSTNYHGEAFQPVKAVPIDLFPQTMLWDLLLLFERQ